MDNSKTYGLVVVPVVVDAEGTLEEHTPLNQCTIYPLEMQKDTVVNTDIRHGDEHWVLTIAANKQHG